MKIFVVEDDPFAIKNLEYQFKSLDIEFAGFASEGENAVKLIQEIQPDLVLVDIQLEGELDGIETTRLIQNEFDLPVIYLTVSTDEETIARAKETDPYGYILKPFNNSELSITIEMALYKHKMAAKLQRSEARISQILDSLPDQIVQIDPEKEFIQKYYGHLDRKDDYFHHFVDKPLSVLFPDKDLKLITQKIHTVLQSHHPDIYSLWMEFEGKKVYWEVRIIDSGAEKILLIIRDTTSQKLAQEKIDRTSEKLRALAANLQQVREEERTRIARDLHDELGHILTVVKIDLSTIRQTAKDSELKEIAEPLTNTIELINNSINSIKRIITELRPAVLDHLGLGPALEWQLDDFSKHTSITYTSQINYGDERLPREVETSLFRIFQETLTNISRHSQATTVDVKLSSNNNGILLSVHDNGIGLDENDVENSKSLGILGMNERAKLVGGRLIISGTPGRGTTISVVVPT